MTPAVVLMHLLIRIVWSLSYGVAGVSFIPCRGINNPNKCTLNPPSREHSYNCFTILNNDTRHQKPKADYLRLNDPRHGLLDFLGKGALCAIRSGIAALRIGGDSIAHYALYLYYAHRE